MKATSMYICLEGLKFFARHGVAPQETVVGANFTIDLKLKNKFYPCSPDRQTGGNRKLCRRTYRGKRSYENAFQVIGTRM